MIKGMPAKEARSSRRNMTMLPAAFKNDVINSAKELKRYRSNKNIDLTTFVEVIGVTLRTKMKRLSTSTRS